MTKEIQELITTYMIFANVFFTLAP